MGRSPGSGAGSVWWGSAGRPRTSSCSASSASNGTSGSRRRSSRMPSPVCNLLPGPASTQLAIYCASRVAGWPGAIVGGAGFILPGLAVILALAALFLSGSAPEWARALGAGGGAAVAAVAVRAGVDLMRPSWLAAQARRLRWAAYVCAGCGRCRPRWPVARHRPPRVRPRRARRSPRARRLRRAGTARRRAARRRLGGARLDSVQGRRPELWRRGRHHSADAGRRGLALPLDDVGPVPRAVALGQITPGPVVQTVAVVGYAAFGVAGGLVAAAIAFSLVHPRAPGPAPV